MNKVLLGMCNVFGFAMMVWFVSREGKSKGETLGFWTGVALVFLSALAIALRGQT